MILKKEHLFLKKKDFFSLSTKEENFDRLSYLENRESYLNQFWMLLRMNKIQIYIVL